METLITGKVKEHFAFFIIVILTIIFAYPYLDGISPFDPGEYCKCAVQLLRGEPDFNNFYCNRLGSYLPIALAIKLFGFNGYYLSWVTVIELVVLIMVVYLSLQRYNREIALITCAFIGFSPLMLELSGSLWGDIMTALTTNLCILWIWYNRFITTNREQIIAGIVLAVLWYVALITKESAVYYLFPLLIIYIDDKRKKQYNRFWNAAIITGIGIGVLFLSVYVLKTDHPFTRVQLLEGGVNKQYIVSWSVLLARVTVLPLKFFIENFSYYIIFPLSLLQLFSKSENDKERFFKMYLVPLLILWWIGTQSFSSWKPVLLVDRLWLPLMVPMAINAAHLLYSVRRGNAKRYATWQTKIILTVVAVFIPIAGIFADENTLNTAGLLEFISLRMGMLILLFLAIFRENVILYLMDWIKQNAVVVLLLLIPLIGYNIHTVYWKNPKDNNYLSDQEMINTVLQTKQEATIISDKIVYHNHGIYYGFDRNLEQQIHFADWNKINVPQIEELALRQPVYLLLTKDRLLWYTSYPSKELNLFIQDMDSIPAYVLNPGLNWELVKQNSRTSLYKYKLAP